jgi:hypothetical protein
MSLLHNSSNHEIEQTAWQTLQSHPVLALQSDEIRNDPLGERTRKEIPAVID